MYGAQCGRYNANESSHDTPTMYDVDFIYNANASPHDGLKMLEELYTMTFFSIILIASKLLSQMELKEVEILSQFY